VKHDNSILDQGGSELDNGVPWLLLGGYTLTLFVSSASLAQKYGGAAAVGGYGVTLLVATVLIWRLAPGLLQRFSDKGATIVTASLLLVMGLILLVGYPVANSGVLGRGSDRDEALVLATTNLLAGRYPYHGLTYLGNPITPLPGALFLATPFVAAGVVAAQNVAWLAIFLVVVRAFFLDARTTLAMLVSMLVLSPVLWQEWLTGGDFLANSLYVLVACVLLRVAVERSAPWLQCGSALFLGVALSGRLHFLFLLPILYGSIAHCGYRRAMMVLAPALVSFSMLTLPFWLYDPSSFSPLHTLNKVGIFEVIVPFSRFIFPVVTLLVALALTPSSGNSLDRLLRNSALVLAMPVAMGVILPLAPPNYRLNLGFGGSYVLSFMFFVTLLFWRRLQARVDPDEGPYLCSQPMRDL
jgi:hypothetical protein